MVESIDHYDLLKKLNIRSTYLYIYIQIILINKLIIKRINL
jgi:hypothetical protein